ncbi:HAMP domain-containing sensor histidine kinase [Prevotella sp. P6B4]|uniref:sensor histidine kinase n=1 Tax=Prevotella sp. P6B4 TaxID=1410614 RepID=UPI000491B0DB|nr:sensor histidine kinase [Prevotella sp. P6B4]
MKKVFILLFCLSLGFSNVSAQETKKSELHQRAESELAKGSVAGARFNFIRAFEEYAKAGQLKAGMECATRGAAMYYRDNFWKEAFDLLRRADQEIDIRTKDSKQRAALHYIITKERLVMYIKLRKSDSAKDQIGIMENQVTYAADEALKNDLLYNKAVYHYSFGQNAQGNAVFQEMASKLTASKQYDKVDGVYQTLIANARRSGNANMVAQSYSNYLAWKDSVNNLKLADETGALKKQIADNEAKIDDQASSLTARQAIIVGLCILAAALAAALVLGGIVLMRFILLTRNQKKTIRLANDNNALKAKFISNISAQLNPTLHKLDAKIPEVKALLDFSEHIATLSNLENSMDEAVAAEDVQITPFCESLAQEVKPKLKKGVALKVNVPNLSVSMNKEYVSHILLHLLNNAVIYVPEDGTISLEYKKRGAHVHQFLVSNTGEPIPEDKRDDVFKPFTEVKDFTEGDGLGLPICKQMALKMKGDLDIDPEFTKGTRFVLLLHS